MSLEVRIRKKFKGFFLDVDFVQEGGCMGILGASGCGKSMTLKCIAGIETPDEGRICLDGEILFDSKKKINKRPQDRNVGFLFQNYALFPTMTVEENIACGIRERKKRKEIVREQIGRFRLEGLEDHRPAQLSGGQQQRVALARMLAGSPRLILLDEPFSALDTFLRDQMHQEMKKIIRDFPGEVLLVSHNREEIYKFSDTLTVIEKGKTVRTGDMKEIFRSPGRVSIARLTGLKNISAYRKLGEREILAVDWNIRLRLGQGDGEHVPDQGYVGVRGHHVLPAADCQERDEGRMRNLYRPLLEDVQEAPFENVYLLRNAAGGDRKPFWWMKPKSSFGEPAEKELPAMLYLPPEALMLLEEDDPMGDAEDPARGAGRHRRV